MANPCIVTSNTPEPSHTDREALGSDSFADDDRIEMASRLCRGSFNPKPEAMAGSEMDRPQAAPAIASGFGLNEDAISISPASQPQTEEGVRHARRDQSGS